MANGLFATPEQVRQREALARAQLAQTQNPLAGGLFNLGNALGNTFIRAGGGDPRSDAERSAAQIAQLVQGIDITDAQNVVDRIRALSEAGFVQESMALGQLVPKRDNKFSQPFIMQGQAPDGTPVNFLAQVNTATDEIKKLGELKNTATPTGATGGLSPDWSKEVTMSEDERNLFQRQMAAVPELASMFGGRPDPEQFKGILGRVTQVANLLKQKERQQVAGLTEFRDKLPAGTFERLTAGFDTAYNQEAFSLLLDSGFIRREIANSITPGAGEEKVSLRTPSLEQLETLARAAREGNIAEEEFEAAGGSAVDQEVVSGIPTDFAPERLSPSQGVQVFGTINEGTTVDQIQDSLENLGFTFNDPAALASNQRIWQDMIENQEFVRNWVNGTDESQDLQLRRIMESFLPENGGWNLRGAIAIDLSRYLKRFTDKTQRQEQGFTPSQQFGLDEPQA